MGPSAVRWANTGAPRHVRVLALPYQPIGDALQAPVVVVVARSDSFVACLGWLTCFTLAQRKLL
jgi:hypothetical protein